MNDKKSSLSPLEEKVLAALRADESDRRTDAQRLKDIYEIAILHYDFGYTQSQIAESIGKSQPTISRDLKAARQMFLESTIDRYERALMQKIARSEIRYEEAWEAWQQSKENAKSSQTSGGKMKVKVKGDEMVVPGPSTATVKTEERDGNPKFLEIMRKEDELQSKMLGLLKDEINVNNTFALSSEVMNDAREKAQKDVKRWRDAIRGNSKVH